jgi:methionyl-tRNA formyltransferase
MGYRLVLLGSDEIALPAFEAALAHPEVTVVAIYSQPDRPSGRGQEIQSNPIASWAKAKGLLLRQPEKLTVADAQQLKQDQVDLGVVMAYGQILKEDFLTAPVLGLVNLHGSLLPQLRGATPVEGALALGWTKTGVSLQQIVRQLDAGPLHGSISLEIRPEDSRVTLRQRLGVAGGELLQASLPKILTKTSVPVPQDHAQATFTRRLLRTDAPLNFNADAAVLAHRIKALAGWPGSTFEYQGSVLKVGGAYMVEGSNDAPGKVLAVGREGIRVACGRGHLVLTHLQRPGGKMLPAAEFLAGYRLEVGSVLPAGVMPDLVSSQLFSSRKTG